jgi:hypothetical protein
MRKDLGYFMLAMVLSCTRLTAQVSPTAPAPNRTITAPGLQRPPVDHPGNAAGTIEGFVYWDASHFSHVPAGSCSGLAVTVSVGSSSGGPLTAYTPLGTLSNNFKYVGQVKEFLAGGKVNVYDVCTYGYDHVPVGPDLQVKLTVTQPGAFSPVAVPQVATLGPIKIINGQCNMLPRVTNPTASDLFAHWSSCQNMAYDVNFVMQMAPRNPNADGGGGSITVFSGSPQGMLSGGQPQGMLASGAGSTVQSSSTSGGLLENGRQTTASTSNGSHTANRGLTRNASARTLTNSDVTAMLKAGLGESVIISSIRSARKNFDFSPAGCEALRRAHVTAAILTEMGDGSVRPCPELTGTSPATTPGSKVELNPQPLPPRTTAAAGAVTQASRAALAPQRIAALNSGCTINQLQLRIRTGNDDLRGGQNNLNVEVHFAGGMDVANNVNHGANWANNSTHVVTVPLQHPVAPNQISMIRLVHVAHGGYTPPNAGQGASMATPAGPALAPIYAAQGLQSEDNWDMAEFQAFGLGSAINVPIASFGSHRFTGSYPSLDINPQPGVGCPSGNQVSKISFTFSTGDDDLRGGNDNLNVTIHFADGATQFEPNVNHSARWPDGSTTGAEVLLTRSVTIDQIKAITLSVTFTGGLGGDNWNMNSMRADAWVNGKYHTIAQYGFHRFSADSNGPKAKEITIPTHSIN